MRLPVTGPLPCPMVRRRSAGTPSPRRRKAGIRSAGAVALVARGWRETAPVTSTRAASVFAGFRFPPEVISVAVRWYLRYGLSYPDGEELLAEGDVTVYRWVQRFTQEFIEAARPCRPHEHHLSQRGIAITLQGVQNAHWRHALV